MQLFSDAVIAVLAAVGLAALLYALINALTRPCKPFQGDAAVLVPCRGDGSARLEAAVRALVRARCTCGGFRRIVILDCGMDEDARAVAALLCREAFDVTLCRAENYTFKEDDP